MPETGKEPDAKQPGAGGSAEAGARKSQWAGLLESAWKTLMPVLLTGASLVGFVAFAGGVIVWTRFSAAKVPPDQAVNAVPRDELVAIGSSLLLIFGFFGLLALACAFLVDRGARATPGMARALLILFLIESVTTIVTVSGLSLEQTIVAAELVALPVAAAFWATFLKNFVELKDDLEPRAGERTEPRKYEMLLLPGGSGLVTWLPLAAIVGTVALMVFGAPDWAILAWLTGAIGVLVICAVVHFQCQARSAAREIADDRQCQEQAEKTKAQALDEQEKSKLSAAEYREWKKRAEAEASKREEHERLLNDRPLRLRPREGRAFFGLLFLAAAVILPWCRLGPWWVGVSIAAAALLTVALWRISSLSVGTVAWYGIAVFISVPLFGTLTAMARNVADPQVQPMALIRNTDGPYEAIQGLYVTEAKDRVYFATVATEGCSNELREHTGRLEWVPKSEVVAMSVGPLQDVEQAAGTALEMAYALTPAVETRAGGEATETPAEKAAAEAEEKPTGPVLDKRLEDTGSAVRPYYGAGLSLSPEDASPGDHVTLKMSAPNEEVDGFGTVRNGRTVRVGGVRARILKEPARSAEGAEYLETSKGTVLKLEKGGPFVEVADDKYESIAKAGEEDEPAEFVELVDPKVLEVAGHDQAEGGWYLKLDPSRLGPGQRPRLAESDLKVTLKGARNQAGVRGPSLKEPLRPQPLGQAWHNGEIRFEVPENATTSAVTVECSQLAGQPLLRVSHAPEARIAVHMRAGTTHVTFDSSRSSDADEEEGKLSRHWNVSGLQRGNLEKMPAELPARLEPYSVTMTIADESGSTDTVDLHLLRLPASLFEFGRAELQDEAALVEARGALDKVVRAEPPAAIEVDGHADYPGTRRFNANLSLRRARYVREKLLSGPLMGATVSAGVPVRTLAYGEGCPVDPRSGPRPRDRRVDVFVLEPGVSIASDGCDPLRFESSRWQLLTCKREPPPEDEPAATAHGFEGEFRALVGGVLDYLLPNRDSDSGCGG